MEEAEVASPLFFGFFVFSSFFLKRQYDPDKPTFCAQEEEKYKNNNTEELLETGLRINNINNYLNTRIILLSVLISTIYLGNYTAVV